MIERPGKSDKSGAPPDYLNVAVTFERPDLSDLGERSLGSGDRSAIFEARTSQSAAFRDRMVAWLEDQLLSDEVYRVGDPTAFSTLFVVASPQVVERLSEIPGVVDVSEAGGSDFKLLT